MGVAGQVWGRERGRVHGRWRLSREADQFHLVTHTGEHRFSGRGAEQLRPGRRWFRPVIEIVSEGGRMRLRGLTKNQARELNSAITAFLARTQAAGPLAKAVEWRLLVNSTLAVGQAQGRWIPQETVVELLAGRPSVDPRTWFEGSEAVLFAEFLSAEEKAALKLMHQDLEALVNDANESIFRSELHQRRTFFESVESSPLTEEQIRAVVSFDNRVQVVASAGSGKTSVMVARAAYAIARDIVPAHRILLLAFNKAAAVELQNRLEARLSKLGLSTVGLRASTFHSFGLDVIGRATGRKPRPAPWLDGGQDVGMVSRIVDELRDSSQEFRFKWDLFRLLYARVSEEPDADEYDAWDPQNRRAGFNTFRGDVVKSEGERMIADWLYLNGVDYRYEQPYVHDVASESKSQYRPDFFYPNVDAWHEHWALGKDGKPPESFTGYAETMRWKRALHRKHQTTLVETTWAEIIDGRGFTALAERLRGLGLTLDWNPDRPTPGVSPPRHEDLARLMRTFMTHVKSNGWTREQLAARQASGRASRDSARTRLFLDVYWKIHDAWEAKLAEADCVDFEDMLVRAVEHLERGEAAFDYTLVMVDEFQDVSQARARLTKALVSDPGRYLLVVGDDWQSINRFAGADMSVMTSFESWFGKGLNLRLQTTFRCPQSICDVSSAFVMKNERQLPKSVLSAKGGRGATAKVVYVDDAHQIPKAIGSYLDGLASAGGFDTVTGADRGRVRVDVLGRYNFDRQLVPPNNVPGVELSFRTVHSSKGLEADYVVIPNLMRGTHGFPSEIADDPVLDLVMAEPDDYPHAEERRLFYVALTRARREVVLVAVRGKESAFLRELMEDEVVEVIGDDGSSAPTVCPGCSNGILVVRRGPYGEFYGCNTFPRCRHKEKITA